MVITRMVITTSYASQLLLSERIFNVNYHYVLLLQ
eukprot:SAG31_NODE_1084_length_10007_cov_4.353452_7_plen_35_part_00